LKALCWLVLVLSPAVAFGQLDVFSMRGPLTSAATSGGAIAASASSAPPATVAPTGGSTRPHPAVARIVAPDRDSLSLGSGTLIAVDGDRGLVLTNWHVVRDAVSTVQVLFPDGFQSPGRVLNVDSDWDLAAVEIERPLVSPVRLADAAPRKGDRLTIAGYGPGAFRAASGRCVQFLSPGGSLPFEIVELSAAARQGDSGGPILNSRGELAGVLFGSTARTTSGSHCGRVRQFLDSVPFGSPLEEPAQLATREKPVRLPVVGGGQWRPKPAAAPKTEETSQVDVAAADADAPGIEPMDHADGNDASSRAEPGVGDDDGLMADEAGEMIAVHDGDAAPYYAPLPRYSQNAAESAAAAEDEPAPVQAAIGVPHQSDSIPAEPPAGAADVAGSDAADAAGADLPLGWQDLAGGTLAEQAKTAFAVLGMVGLALHGLRWFRVL
jgi:hypothetical protein